VADGHGDFGGGPDESGKDAEEKVKRENPTCTVVKVEKKQQAEPGPARSVPNRYVSPRRAG
jgi:hypothetical protein